MASLGDLIVRVGAEISDFQTAMKSVIDQVDTMGSKVEDRLRSIGSVGQRLAVVGAEMTAGITLPIEEIGRRALETAAQFEQTQIAFTTFLGSSSAAQEMLGQLYQFAATTPFEVPGVLNGGRMLLAMGFAAKDVVPIMRTLGDAASGLGKGQAGLELLVYHLGQIKALGHIDGAIMREMGQNGIAAAEMIGKATGHSRGEIEKMVTLKDPRLDSTTVINALMSGMNEQFGGLMSNQMNSLSGQWSNFKDQITLTFVAIGNTLLPIGKQLVAWGSDALGIIKELSQWFANLPSPVQTVVLALIALVAAAGPLLTVLGGIMMTIPGIIAGVASLAGFLGISSVAAGAGIIAFTGLAGAIALTLAALVGIGVWVHEHWAGVKAAFAHRWGQGGSSLGDFEEAEAKARGDESDAKKLEEAKSGLHLGQKPFKMTSDEEAFKEQHTREVKQYTEWVKELDKQFKEHKATVQQVTEAHDKLNAKMRETFQKQTPASHAKLGKTAQVDQNALAGITGEESHQEALLNMRRAAVAQEYKESQPTGTDKANMSAEDVSDMEVRAATRRRVELQAIAGDELKITLAAIEKKLQLYKGEETGYRALVESKKKAQDKFVAEFQKAGNEEKDVTKKANEQIEAENRRHQAEEYRAMKAHAEAMAQVQAAIRQGALQHADAERSMAEKQAEMRLEMGEITKKKFLQIKQDEIDKAFQMDLEALADEQRLLIQMQNAALAEVPEGPGGDSKRREINTNFGHDQVGLFNKRQGVVDRHTSDTQGVQNEEKLDHYDKVWKPVQTAFSSGLAEMIKGTKTFKQAWLDMSKGILSAWIGSISDMVSKNATALLQMGAKWVAHHVLKLGVHVATNQAQVASDAAAAAQTNAINQQQHMKDVLRDAKAAALKVWKWTADIPFVGAILAPIAAAATFAAAMAFGSVSAARGAVLPNEPTIGLLHPKEMVLPSHLSEGIQGAINNGTFGSGNQLSPAGNNLNTSVLQQIATNTLNTAQALGYKSGIAGNNLATQDNKPGSPLDGLTQGVASQVFGLFGQSNPQLQQMNMVQLLRVIADNTANLKRGLGGGILGGVLPFFEDGGVSEKDGLAYLHAKEMTLPAHLSTGLQRMITYSGGARMFSGGGSGGGDTHHWGGVNITLHNSAKQPLTPDHVFNALQSAVRGRNLKMA